MCSVPDPRFSPAYYPRFTEDYMMHYKHGMIVEAYRCLYIGVRHILNTSILRIMKHTGESTAYADFESSSFMRFLPIAVLAVDSVVGSSVKF